MRVQLTKRLVDGAKPQAKPFELRDTAMKGLLLRVQPSGHKAWIIEWTRGKRRTLGAHNHLTLEQARAHAAQSMAEFIQAGLPSIAKAKPASCTLEEFLAARYQPWAAAELRCGDRYAEAIRRSFPELLGCQLAAIDKAAIERWWAQRLQQGHRARNGQKVAKATLLRLVAMLRSALSKAVEWKLVERNHLMGFRAKGVEPRKVVRYLSDGEESRLRAALKNRDDEMRVARASGNRWRAERDRTLLPAISDVGFGDHISPLVLLAMNTGLRRGELLSLRWSDVDLERNFVTVQPESAKSGKQRHVPLNAEAALVLRRWKEQSGSADHVFEPNDVKTAWVKLLNRASIIGFRFHDLRHHFASRLVMAGVDLNTVRELLGHADIKMTLRYAHLAPEHLAAAVAKLEM